jgi:hypothetical protein
MSKIAIEHTWDGRPALPSERVALDVTASPDGLRVRVDAPHHGDPAPPAPPGRCEGLWEYEVVELFLLGTGERYLEIEIAPSGHFLVLELHGRRRRVRSDVPVQVACQRSGPRWSAELCVARSELPPAAHAWNAYALHGVGAQRRYLAFQPVPGERPDFHRLECFAPLPELLRAELANRPTL